jgi:hypothetical protein
MNTVVAPSEDAEQPIGTHERLPHDISTDTLRKFFTLTISDLEPVEHCRGPINKIGFAVQLCVLRWRGHFLQDTRDVLGPVLETIASQLGVLPMPLDTYPHNEKTRFEHVERIREHLHFRRCDATQRQRLLEHLTTVAHAIPRSTALRQAAHRWLQEEKIVRPGHTTPCGMSSARPVKWPCNGPITTCQRHCMTGRRRPLTPCSS